jgi:hypothetical protein
MQESTAIHQSIKKRRFTLLCGWRSLDRRGEPQPVPIFLSGRLPPAAVAGAVGGAVNRILAAT